jgi:hypothetical protein
LHFPYQNKCDPLLLFVCVISFFDQPNKTYQLLFYNAFNKIINYYNKSKNLFLTI